MVLFPPETAAQNQPCQKSTSIAAFLQGFLFHKKQRAVIKCEKNDSYRIQSEYCISLDPFTAYHKFLDFLEHRLCLIVNRERERIFKIHRTDA